MEEAGGPEECFLSLYEDQALLVKIGLKAPVMAVSNCWARYRQHPDSCCAIGTRTGQNHLARLFFLNWLEAYLAEQEVRDYQLWHGLDKALWPYRHPRLDALLNLLRRRCKAQIRRMTKWMARHIFPADLRVWMQAWWQEQ